MKKIKDAYTTVVFWFWMVMIAISWMFKLRSFNFILGMIVGALLWKHT